MKCLQLRVFSAHGTDKASRITFVLESVERENAFNGCLRIFPQKWEGGKVCAREKLIFFLFLRTFV